MGCIQTFPQSPLKYVCGGVGARQDARDKRKGESKMQSVIIILAAKGSLSSPGQHASCQKQTETDSPRSGKST